MFIAAPLYRIGLLLYEQELYGYSVVWAFDNYLWLRYGQYQDID